MAGTSLASLVVLLLSLIISPEDSLDQKALIAGGETIPPTEWIAEDSLVNYCKLVRAGYFYGQKFADKRLGLSAQDVEFFNDLWKGVFNIPYYQTGITTQEFILGARFGEGNTAPFPPSAQYHQENPDSYLLFHIAKEVGMIHSQYFSQCPSCVELSTAKINAYMKTAYLHSQISQMWLGTSTLKKVSVSEITDFWVFLRCMFIDDQINPKLKPYFINLPPVVKCPDTTIIKCKDEIKPKVSVGYRHCEIGGKIDTIGPSLVHGIENCPGSIYHIKYIARDQCNKRDSCVQVFVIENEKPSFECPKDTIVFCIRDLVQHTPEVTSSCSLLVTQTTYGPLLVSGKENCPQAVYELEYIVRDTCGREMQCTQKITIQNDPPTITCPADQTVECKEDIKEGVPKYTFSCHAKPKKTSMTGPTLVKGKEDCPGAVYELTYEVIDSCDRTAKCVQKFTIDNKGPEIICPPNQEVLCFDEISTGPPADLIVSCGMGYDVIISDPVLIIGKPNCIGAVYSVTYLVRDACGRTDECEQLFTILQPDLKITCPPDRTVMCEKDIVPEEPTVSVACSLSYQINTEGPSLIKGNPDCPGAEYVIRYEVIDACGRVKECRQTFTISNPDPEIVCPPEQTVTCSDDIDVQWPVPVISCELEYEPTIKGPELMSGTDNCDGARYALHYVVTDACGRSASCTQFFVLKIPPPEITCAEDKTIECEDEIQAEDPKVVTYCDQTYTISASLPGLISGQRNCPGTVYGIEYTVTDDCNRQFTCIQIFVIANAAPTITCPPDRTVDCEEEIDIEDVIVQEVCEEGNLVANAGLISGTEGCPGAVYAIIYTLTDSCGRVAECEQRFTVKGGPLEVVCPPDTIVKSVSDIRPGNIQVTSSCGIAYEITTSGPVLVSGVDGQVGAVYAITYTVVDECGRTASCVRRYQFIGIPDDGVFIICDCWNQYKLVSLDLIKNQNDKVHGDIAALIKKYGCEKVKSWVQSGAIELWNAWATAEILGSGTGVASEIARRGNINIVMQNLEKITKAIEILEEAINGEPKKTLEIIAEWGLTEGLTHLTGSGTPAAVFAAIKSLGEFAQYLNNEILIINIRTLANYADRDPNIFDADHYLREYAKIHEIRPGDRVTWSDIHNPFRIAIWEYAQHRMNDVKLPPLSEIWNNQQNMTLLRTVTHTMLTEVCQYWCYKLTLKQNLNKLIQEQSLLLRFKAVLEALKNYDCQGNDKPCTMPNAELKEVNGVFVCECLSGFKWDPGKIRCLPYTDCTGFGNSVEVYRGDRYECDCPEGYEWNGDRSACILMKPDCPSIYVNSEASWDASTGQWLCYCIQGYEWNTTRTACIPVRPDCPSFYPNTEAVWDVATNQWLCNCISGYEWNSTRTACIPGKPDCPSFYANTEAVWDVATNQWLCNCISGYEWNTTRTACIPVRPDCPSFYANTEAVWDVATNQWLCNCISGYEWNSTRTACIPGKPDCPSFYANTEAVWDVATNQWLCNCISGYEWNSTRTGCIPGKPDCPSFYANTEAVWDVATNQWLCNCISGYEWNSTRTACVAAKPDCPSFYANTEAVWDVATNQWLCNCLSGYEWNSTRTACIAAKPDCPSFYANSEAVWDVATNQWLCNCITGFQWNATRTGCIAAAPDCNTFYPNSVAVWDFATNQYLCNCPLGYVWNASRTQCIPIGAPDCVTFYAHSTPYWDASSNQYLCYCLTGYEWNATRTECVTLGTGNREDPVVNPQQQKTGQCNISYGSGANEPEQYTIDVYKVTGSLQFSFDTYSVKDRIHIYHGGAKVFDSGCVGTSGSQTLTLNGSSSVFRIVVDPLCDPTESDTQWNFTLGCPQ